MRKYISVAPVLLLLAAAKVSAQWQPAPYTSGDIFFTGGNIGIGVTAYSATRLRLANPNVSTETPGSGGQLAFGTNAAQWWIFRMDSALNLHLDRQNNGWFPGITFAHSGRVGINNTAPGARLTVSEYTDGGIAMRLGMGTAVEQNPAQPQMDYGLIVNANQNVYSGVQNLGRVTGVYTEALNTGAGAVTYTIGSTVLSGLGSSATGSILEAYGVHAQVLSGQGTVTTGYGVYVSDTQAINDYAFYQVAANDSNYFAGNTAIGGQPTGNKLEVYGNANFNGVVTGTEIRATYQDLAEWVPSRFDLSPGTVVVLDPTIGNTVIASATAYDTAVAGVVSAQPGLLLGVPGAEKEQIATTGRVRVRVDATRAPIRVGDLLVTGEKPGMAMRSEPMEINGRAFHQPGTILGKALEPLTGGEGEILVLLSLQ